MTFSRLKSAKNCDFLGGRSDGRTDGRTDRPTDRQTDRHTDLGTKDPSRSLRNHVIIQYPTNPQELVTQFDYHHFGKRQVIKTEYVVFHKKHLGSNRSCHFFLILYICLPPQG